MIKLNPCTNCGSDEIMDTPADDKEIYWYCYCMDCDKKTDEVRGSDKAIKLWNQENPE